MAFARLEPFGSHVEDRRAGVVASTLANINRDPKARPEPFGDLDLIPWNDTHRSDQVAAAEQEPILLADPEKQAALINAVMFGEAPVKD
ncbi:DUF4035 domain-containing protein [Pigmentiphaga sp. YJ18]|uniref:phage tail assembly protein T n=1 Tax=Pigmentiphaga sp. YJ18 TaxID=3134907 RepID=UPI0031148522